MRYIGSGGHVGSKVHGGSWLTLRMVAFALVPLASGAAPTSATAQGASTVGETGGRFRPWQVGVWAESGIMGAFGRFASNAVGGAFVDRLDVRAHLEPAVAYSGGMELRLPTRGFLLRAGWETTTGGAAEGGLVVCDLADCVPESVSGTVSGLVVEARIFRTAAERPVVPMFGVGYGRRWYSFGYVDCAEATGDQRTICDATAELFMSPGSHSVVRASAGVRAYLGRIGGDLVASATGGSYSGGEGQTKGLWYPELRVTLGVGLVVF